VVLQERIGTAVKTVQKMFAVMKAAIGVTGEPISGKGPKKSRGGKGNGAMQQARQGGSFPPRLGGIDKQKGAAGRQLGCIKPQCFNYKEFGHVAKK